MEKINVKPAGVYFVCKALLLAMAPACHAMDYHGVKCRIVALFDGWVTAVTDSGSIIQDWAGEFTC